METVRIAVNKYAFYWAFPELVAREEGLYSLLGLDVELTSFPLHKNDKKSDVYIEMLHRRVIDLYHCGEQVGISRATKSREGWLVAKSETGKETLNSSFTLLVRPDSKIKRPNELAHRKIAVELGTGSYYTTISDLERFIPIDSIELVQIGEPHERLMALLDGRVFAASLLGAWVDLAVAMGMVSLYRSGRRNPTVMIANRLLDEDSLRRFLSATNNAIRLMNSDPDKYRKFYFEMFMRALADLPPRIRNSALNVSESVKIYKWKEWGVYTKAEFQTTLNWMVERGLASSGVKFEQIANPNARRLF